MSFVSVIASDSFISMVADGRVVQDGNSIQENYRKFKQIGLKQFVAFAGAKQICEAVMDQINVEIEKMYELSKVAKEIHSAIYGKSELEGINILFVVGGVNINGCIEFYTINRVDEEIRKYKPETPTDRSYAFLHNGMIDEGIVGEKFEETYSKYGVTSLSKCQRVQEELNNKIADLDESVNKITFKLSFRK
ncbi:hypothetical protein CAI16_05460 [Virgibacillus dokdonensis]|uniref:Proteasome endopeptidase complex n=1 Tax=Virgibacillus dokdonensis TaxID=302167 RepID=A0A3E0WW59_9BACI|nr:hypothetical protein [Virgibacillus dokdonensis]RFA36236.1 hypothetical protein CAI16_05460 [Virgibacillus dokdonensis]